MTSRRYRSSDSGRRFPNIDFLFSLRPARWKLGLENITLLLETLGDPQMSYPAVLVGGTNGKGSTVTFISSILREAGLRIGTFYSPHIFRVNERIQVDGEEICSSELDHLIGELRALHDRAPFTFFEGITAAAILHFAARKVDIAVFEVGLGGRLDATRLVNAAVTVITGISHDHREHLGRTRTRILGEKLGVVRPGVPLVARLPTALLERKAHAVCAGLGAVDVSVRDRAKVTRVEIEPQRMRANISTRLRRYGRVETGMIGLHQTANIATAVCVAETLAAGTGGSAAGEKGARSRNCLTRVRAALEEDIGAAVRGGLARAFMPGRFQVLGGSPRIIVDVSHNEEALLASLGTLRRISHRDRTVILFGVLAHKELGRFPALAKRAARDIILTHLRNQQSADVRELRDKFERAESAGRSGAARIATARGMADAVRRARGLLGERDTLLVLGSHFTVLEAAAYL